MNIKRILLAFTLALNALAMSPAHAISSTEYMALAKGHRASLGRTAEEKKSPILKAKSAFKTFKKDIKCVFSREGCTREQKIRLAKQGLGLVGIIAVLRGGGWLAWKSRVKKRKNLSAEASAKEEALAKTEATAKTKASARRIQEEDDAARVEREHQEAAQLARERRDKITRLEEVSAKKERAVALTEKARNAAQAALRAAKEALQKSEEKQPVQDFERSKITENERMELTTALTALDYALAERDKAKTALERARREK